MKNGLEPDKNGSSGGWVRPTFWNRITWIQNPVLPPTNCATVGELLNLSLPKFYPLQKANENGTHFTELL